jgi:S-phase kinase-associated protein 1
LEYLKINDETIFELIFAANYLDISQLLEVCCKQVANMIQGKNPEEIRVI